MGAPRVSGETHTHTYDNVPLDPLVMLQEKAREHTTCSGRKLDTDTELWNILHTSSVPQVCTFTFLRPLNDVRCLRQYLFSTRFLGPIS